MTSLATAGLGFAWVWSFSPRSASVRAPRAWAATRVSTCSGVTARVTVLAWIERSSGRVKAWPEASTSTSSRIVSAVPGLLPGG